MGTPSRIQRHVNPAARAPKHWKAIYQTANLRLIDPVSFLSENANEIAGLKWAPETLIAKAVVIQKVKNRGKPFSEFVINIKVRI